MLRNGCEVGFLGYHRWLFFISVVHTQGWGRGLVLTAANGFSLRHLDLIEASAGQRRGRDDAEARYWWLAKMPHLPFPTDPTDLAHTRHQFLNGVIYFNWRRFIQCVILATRNSKEKVID